MSNSKEIRENLEAQICEMEVLQSVYPRELKIADHGNLADINEYVAGNRENLPQRLEYSIEITIPEASLELLVNLPLDYPSVKPVVYASSSSLNRAQQTRLNVDLNKFVRESTTDEPCIYSLVSWMQDNSENYFDESKTPETPKKKRSGDKGNAQLTNLVFARYWIYSHHIYSNSKRKEIMEEARENLLTGFCLAGKPGIICVEGAKDDCEYWWQKIKVMNWHKILVKFIEEEDSNEKFERYRKFTGFHEISFATTEKHNDMGQLRQYLTDHDSQHIFKELFGIEGKTTLSAE